MMKYRASTCLYEVSIINFDNELPLSYTCQIYIFSDLDNFIYLLCNLGGVIYGKFFPPVPKLEKLKMSQQHVSNEFPLILPVPIVMMFSLLCFNKVSGRTYMQAKRVSSFHHMNKSPSPEAVQCKRAKRVCPFKENSTHAPRP